MQYIIFCLQAPVVKTKERKSSLWNLLSSRWSNGGTFIPNIIIIIIFEEEMGWVTRHKFYWKFWIFWNKVKKIPLLIILVSATGRQSHSLTLCSDCIDGIVQFWSLTWDVDLGKEKVVRSREQLMLWLKTLLIHWIYGNGKEKKKKMWLKLLKEMLQRKKIAINQAFRKSISQASM